MALLRPNTTYSLNGVVINEKIIPDGTVWKDSKKAEQAGFSKGQLYKSQNKINGNGLPIGITVHNTTKLVSLAQGTTQAEQYTRATYEENMMSSRVHFYVDDKCAWQNLKCGLGISRNDSKGSSEVGWHAGDGAYGMGNYKTIALELIMDGWFGEYNQAVAHNGAKIIAYLLKFYKLSINDVYTHTYFINNKKGVKGSTDYMNTYRYPNVFKMCPYYILPYWSDFLSMVQTYMGDSKIDNEVSYPKNNIEPDIGDIVEFVGNTHYSSVNASKGFEATPGKAKVTNIYKTGKHPYHLVATEGSTSNVYGWVDLADLQVIEDEVKAPKPIMVSGDKIIWDYLLSNIKNPYGVAGLMGNLYAESGLRSNNLQNGYEQKLGMSDEMYTEAVDNKSYNNFVRDSAGYGLAQWTYWSRKEKLLKFVQSKNKSIGDLSTQLEFLIDEIKKYTSVWNVLKTATSVKQASDVVLLDYECPANQSESVKSLRASYGEGYYSKYASKVSNPVEKVIQEGSKVKIKSSATVYYDGGPKIPSWVKSQIHVVTKTSLNGKEYIRGGKVCYLLGKKVVNNSIVPGIMTLVDRDQLELV